MFKKKIINHVPMSQRNEPERRCRVCGKVIHRGEDHIRIEHAGMLVLVCCEMCEKKFTAEPEMYTVNSLRQ